MHRVIWIDRWILRTNLKFMHVTYLAVPSLPCIVYIDLGDRLYKKASIRWQESAPPISGYWGVVEPWLMARWKARVEFLLIVVELIFLSLTVEALQGKMCQKNSLPSEGGGSLWAKISVEGAVPLPIYWYHSKSNWLRYNFAADSFYIMELCSRLLVLYCRNCLKDDKFRYLIPILRKFGRRRTLVDGSLESPCTTSYSS